MLVLVIFRPCCISNQFDGMIEKVKWLKKESDMLNSELNIFDHHSKHSFVILGLSKNETDTKHSSPMVQACQKMNPPSTK